MRNSTITLERLTNGYILRTNKSYHQQALYNPDGTKRHGNGPYLIKLNQGSN